MNSLKGESDRSQKTAPNRPKKSRDDDQQMGASLRQVYQATVEEEIPKEMLDLLGKLD